jgi:phage baseplate assembly protein W|tara:strand:+ start:226 stop:669 length:444 start_codon:yes stop_codon:yes gene_type:complete
MAIRDTKIKPFIEDRDENVSIGIDLPFRKSDGPDGWFASSSTTIEAVKNNIRYLLQTEQGERYMQPNLGLGLRKYMFEQVNEDTTVQIQGDILTTIGNWLPFVEVRELDVSMEGSDTTGRNKLSISVVFNITRDPSTLESVQVEIGD